MALKSTILELRDRARDSREAELDRPRMVEGWRHDIGEVHDVIRAALKPYVDDGSAAIGVEDVEVEEEDLGRAVYPRLVIEIVGRRIDVTPVARFTVGGTGRIDMYRKDRPTEDHRVLIVRGLMPPGSVASSWLIEQKSGRLDAPSHPVERYMRGTRRYHDLAPASIEDAVEYLLRLP